MGMQAAMLVSDTWPKELNNKVIWAETLYLSHKRRSKDGKETILKKGNYTGSAKGMEKYGFELLLKWLKLTGNEPNLNTAPPITMSMMEIIVQ